MTQDQQPLTLDELREALRSLATKEDLARFATKDDLKNLVTTDALRSALRDFPTKEELRAELNDRFGQWDAKHDREHEQLRQDFAELIDRVNNHTTAELRKLRQDLDFRQEFDQLAASVAERFGVSVADLTGGRT